QFEKVGGIQSRRLLGIVVRKQGSGDVPAWDFEDRQQQFDGLGIKWHRHFPLRREYPSAADTFRRSIALLPSALSDCNPRAKWSGGLSFRAWHRPWVEA